MGMQLDLCPLTFGLSDQSPARVQDSKHDGDDEPHQDHHNHHRGLLVVFVVEIQMSKPRRSRS
jgi:hypothetical protein